MLDHDWADRLSAYLDDDLDPPARAEVEAALAASPELRALRDELRAVQRRARGLADRDPATDLWPGIAREIGVASPRRPPRLQGAWLAAAGLALVAGSAAVTWVVATRAAAPPPVAAAAATPAAPPLTAVPVTRRPEAARSVAALEEALAAGRTRLDSGTVKVLERNLAIIDSALADAERALAADPSNAYLNSHLAATYRRKLALLRDAAALIARS